LDGTGSSDPDSLPSPLTYRWTQIDGPAEVKIANFNQAVAQFQVSLPGTYVFQLQVSDGAATATDEVAILAPRSTPR
jgi:hypothetical protein